MRILRRLLVVLAWPLLHLTYLVAGWIPRDKGLWAFGSFYGRRMADNPKWLYLHLVAQAPPGVRPVWITRSAEVVAIGRREGWPVHHAQSLRGVWASLRAGVYVVEQNVWDVAYWTSRGALLVNLWHGIPLKKVNSRIDDPTHIVHKAHYGTGRQRARLFVTHPWARRDADLMIATSPHVARLMADVFRIPEWAVPVTGYPRNDALMADRPSVLPQDVSVAHQAKAWRSEGRRVVAYMPTWRYPQPDGQPRRLPLDWDRLDAFLAERNARLIVKLHPMDDARPPPAQRLDHIHVVDAMADPYPMLRHMDVLMTGYSSVFFDFVLLDRPMVFYAPDLDDYQATQRPLYEDYDEVTPGPVATDFPELLDQLEAALDAVGENDPWDTARARIRRRYHAFADAGSSGRVAEAILRRVGAVTS